MVVNKIPNHSAGAPLSPLLEYFETEINELLVLAEIQSFQGKVGTSVDRIFLLRYLISHNGNLKKSRDSILRGLKWRVEHLDQLASIKNGDYVSDTYETFERLMVKGWCGFLGKEKNPVMVSRGGLVDFKTLGNSLTEDELKDCLLMNNELGFQLCDSRTRESGALVKVFMVVDALGLSISKFDKGVAKAFGKSSGESSDMFPQLLAKLVLFNFPTIGRYIIKFLDMFQTERVINKRVICNKGVTVAEACCFSDDTYNSLPDFLGGSLSDLDESLKPGVERRDVEEITFSGLESISLTAKPDQNRMLLEILGTVQVTCESAGVHQLQVDLKDGLYKVIWIPQQSSGISVCLTNTCKKESKVQVRFKAF